MPTFQATNAMLYAYQRNLLQFKQDYPAMCEIFPSMQMAIKKYEGYNKTALVKLFDQQKALYDKYVVKDEHGNYQYEEQKRSGGAPREMFLSAESAEAFDREWKAILDTPVQITV